MPIYAYRCASCGHEQDVLQKMSDPLLTQCPACGKDTYEKQVTAAGFQLKGSGWYVTDFRDGGKNTKGASAGASTQSQSSGDSSGSSSGGSTASSDSKPAAAPASSGKSAD